MMDESNDKTDKSCIILVRCLDPSKRKVRTCFLDMPIVNIGNAPSLFAALKSLLAMPGDFSNSLVFMSDTDKCHEGSQVRGAEAD